MDDLNIILPVYNEKETIETVLKEWSKELEKYKMSYHFIVCEDGSKDGTKELLKSIKEKYNLILNQKEKRRGYGGAVISGIKTSQSKYILCLDSDGQCDPDDFPKFWQIRDSTDVVMGWRRKRIDCVQRKIFSLFFKSVFMILFPTSIHDPSAPFVLFKKKNITPYLKYLTFLNEGFWWNFVGLCVKKKLSIAEIPIKHRERKGGGTQVYHLHRIPSIAVRNLWGAIRLKFVS